MGDVVNHSADWQTLVIVEMYIAQQTRNDEHREGERPYNFNVDVGKGEEGDEDEQGEEDECSHCTRGGGRMPLLEYCNEHETSSNDHECGIELVVDFRWTDMIEAGEEALPHHGESYTIVQGPVLVQAVNFSLVSLPGYINEQTEERTAHNIADVAEDVVECLEAQKVVRAFEVVVALKAARVVLVLEEHELGRGQRVKDAHQHQQLVVSFQVDHSWLAL